MTHLRHHLPHLVDQKTVMRAHNAVLLTFVCGGLAASAMGALIYEVGRVFGAW